MAYATGYAKEEGAPGGRAPALKPHQHHHRRLAAHHRGMAQHHHALAQKTPPHMAPHHMALAQHHTQAAMCHDGLATC